MAQAGGGQGRGGTRLAWGGKSAVSLSTPPDPAQHQTLLLPELHKGSTSQHPSTPLPPSPVATPSPRHSRPGRQGMDAPVLAPAPWPRAVRWSCPLHSRACSCPGCCCGPHSAPAGSPSPRPPACPRAPAARGCSPAAAVALWRRVPAGQPRACVPVPCRASCRAQVFLLGGRSY